MWTVTIDQRAGSGATQRFEHESTAVTLKLATAEAIQRARLTDAEVGDYQITATQDHRDARVSSAPPT